MVLAVGYYQLVFILFYKSIAVRNLEKLCAYVLRYLNTSVPIKKLFQKLPNSEKSYLEFSTLKSAIQILYKF